MLDNIYRSFTLNNSHAAISATVDSLETLATDGFECQIYRLNTDGDTIQCHQTFRPYRRLRTYGGCLITALGCCEGNLNVYFLTENFRENDYITLNSSCGSNCNWGCSNWGELTDASLTQIGNDTYIIGVFRKNAFLFDLDGKRLTRLCTADNNEILTDFVSLTNGSYAMGTLCGNHQTITVSDGNNIQSCALSRTHVLRMLIPQGDELFGLFGRGYIYNRIIKIYSNGILTLPNG